MWRSVMGIIYQGSQSVALCLFSDSQNTPWHLVMDHTWPWEGAEKYAGHRQGKRVGFLIDYNVVSRSSLEAAGGDTFYHWLSGGILLQKERNICSLSSNSNMEGLTGWDPGGVL